jgi:diguanylate cyclase (GGDEF)-like protein
MRALNGFLRAPRIARRAALVLLIVAGVVALVYGAGRWTSTAVRHGAERQLADRVQADASPVETSLDSARTRALIIATDPVVQRLLVQRNVNGLRKHLPADARVDSARKTIAGRIEKGTAPVSVSLVAKGRVAGSVVVGARVPHFPHPFVVTKNGVVVSGPGISGRVSLPYAHATWIDLGGRRYLAVGVTLPARGSHWVTAAVLPASTVAHRLLVARLRIGAAAAAALGALIAGALLLREARRRRSFRLGTTTESALTLGLLGDALAATHELEVLLPVILRAFMRASRAPGGRVLEAGEEVARTGRWTQTSEPFTVELGAPSGAGQQHVVELYGLTAKADPVRDALMQSLAVHARTALENAHLHQVVEQQASTDELTRLANRRRFMEVLHRELRRVERFGGSLAVVLADLDDFKRVNDRFGHQAGDDVLVLFAEVMRAELRDIDLAARIGGEEFAILLPETDLDGAVSLAERIRGSLGERRLRIAQGRPLRVTASFGVAAQRGGEDADLLVLSDAALYRAKRRGKNRVVA